MFMLHLRARIFEVHLLLNAWKPLIRLRLIKAETQPPWMYGHALLIWAEPSNSELPRDRRAEARR